MGSRDLLYGCVYRQMGLGDRRPYYQQSRAGHHGLSQLAILVRIPSYYFALEVPDEDMILPKKQQQDHDSAKETPAKAAQRVLSDIS